jgi:lipoprotein-releasing system ATP-binding protein
VNTMMEATVQVRDIAKRFQLAESSIQVLNGISFDARSGENLVITGPSGSGKSTLLHILGTLEPPTSGTVRLNGCDPFDQNEVRLSLFRNQNIGFVFQEHYLLPQYSVLENILLPALAGSFSISQEIRGRALDLVEQVGLSHRTDHRPAQLSGGECQRVAIARALINRPPILLCDEPTGSLDRTTARRVADVLFEVKGQDRALMIAVTHSPELADRFSRHLHLEDGACTEV